MEKIAQQFYIAKIPVGVDSFGNNVALSSYNLGCPICGKPYHVVENIHLIYQIQLENTKVNRNYSCECGHKFSFAELKKASMRDL